MQSPFLRSDAAAELLEILRASLWVGIIGDETFLVRIEALRELCHPHSTVRKLCETLLRAEEWGDISTWEDMPNKTATEVETFPATSNAAQEVDDGGAILRFVPPSSTNMHGWLFHKTDADPHPSVPHGHSRSRNSLKLDPYLGYLYVKLRQQDHRVPRRDIVALWNDDDFREFAAEAIQFFASTRFGWHWRVPHPHRLPRKRR